MSSNQYANLSPVALAHILLSMAHTPRKFTAAQRHQATLAAAARLDPQSAAQEDRYVQRVVVGAQRSAAAQQDSAPAAVQQDPGASTRRLTALQRANENPYRAGTILASMGNGEWKLTAPRGAVTVLEAADWLKAMGAANELLRNRNGQWTTLHAAGQAPAYRWMETRITFD